MMYRVWEDRKSEKGFTLTELLVVIAILGILAAVVVFAVGQIGDKGQSSACAADKHTIETAEEAYYAKNGSYTDTAGLVSAHFLRSTPTYYKAASDGTVSPLSSSCT